MISSSKFSNKQCLLRHWAHGSGSEIPEVPMYCQRRSGLSAPENSPDAFEKMVSVIGEMCKCLALSLYKVFSGKSFHCKG